MESRDYHVTQTPGACLLKGHFQGCLPVISVQGRLRKGVVMNLKASRAIQRPLGKESGLQGVTSISKEFRQSTISHTHIYICLIHYFGLIN